MNVSYKINRIASIWFCVLAILLYQQAFAEEPLSLQQVIESVNTHFPLIQAAEKDQKIAEAEVVSAKGAFDPQFRIQGEGSPLGYYQNGRFEARYTQPTPFWGTQLFAGYRVGLGGFPSYDGKLQTNQYGELFAGIEVPLWRNGPIDRRRADIKKAEISVSAASASIKQQQIDSLRIASFRYWDWLAAGKRLQVMTLLLELAEKRNDQLKRRVEEGDLAAIDQIDNERMILQRKGLQQMAERMFEQAQIDLSLYVRDEKGVPIIATKTFLPPSFPMLKEISEFNLDRDTETALENRPELKRLDFQKKQFDIEKIWAKNQLAPQISLYAGVNQDFGPGDPSRSQFGLDLGLRIDFAIPNRFAKGKIKAAEFGISRTETQSNFVRDQIKTELLNAFSALRISRKRIDLAKEELLVAKQTQEAEWKKYQRGDSNLIFVNAREQTTAETEMRWIDATTDYWKAEAAYQAAMANR